MGTLYIVPTPIGNLEDMTLRALRILREVKLIAAEDTRVTRVLLDHYDIRTPMTSYHEHNKQRKLSSIFRSLADGDVALVSDAGTPSVSDPGYELVNEAARRGTLVVPLPGANAILTALVGSALPTDGFVYVGFLPKKKRLVRETLTSLEKEKRTLVAFESPYRLFDTLEIMLETLGDRPVCVAQEMSKMFEEFFRGPISAALEHFGNETPRGEITLVIGGLAPGSETWDEERVRAALRERLDEGESPSRAAKSVAAESGWKKRDVYAMGVEDD